MSSGNNHSSLRFFASFFFEDLRGPFEDEGRAREERGADAKRVLEDCAAEGLRKSIWKGVLAVLGPFVAAAVAVSMGSQSPTLD